MRIPFSAVVLSLPISSGQVFAAPVQDVVFILADDLGYGDLKCSGRPHARAPNLDQLAEQGMRFTSNDNDSFRKAVRCTIPRAGSC